MRLSALLLFLTACAHVEDQRSIGSATMLPDGTIEMALASRECDGTIVHGAQVITVDNPGYQDMIRRIGGLEPGETKPVPAWPSSPCK